VDDLLDAAPSRPRPKEGETWQRMTKVMPHLTKLNLTEPHARNFAPNGCRSLHDIVRYTHETAVREMFTLVGKGGRGLGAAKKLDSGLPLTMYVLDVGGGLTQGAHAKQTVSPKDLAGTPMLALWRGLATEKAVWNDDMPHMDWEEFDRISAGVFAKDSKVLASYGVLSEDYLHLMIRFGYHFSVLDSVCGTEANANYVNFQFRGGGGSFSQRVMRLEMIGNVLSRFGFETQSKGDLFEASFQRGGLDDTARRLTLLGALMAETRLMDMRLTQEAHIAEAVEQFLADHGGEDEAHVFKKDQ
jgi:pyruvate,water dikinase